MKQRKEFRQLLSEKKLKKTSQRELVWKVLLDSKGHPSVEEIRDMLIDAGHRIGLATVYRTLKILLASGLIRQSRHGGMTRYEAVVAQPNHLHFVCNVCKSNVEYPSRKIEKLIGALTSEYDFEERYSRYAIFGLCKACQKAERKTANINERTRLEKTAARDALELTLAIERLGYTFYMNASRKTTNDSGRIMFQRLAAEESEHMRSLQREYRDLLREHQWLKREPVHLPVSRKIAHELFPQKDLLRFQVNAETTELEALNIAIDLERRSHRFFTAFAKQLRDPAGRKAFMNFAQAEESHLEMLLNEYKTIAHG